MELQGKIKLINDEVTRGNFNYREVVITTTDEQYPQDIIIQFAKDKTSLLDKYSLNDKVVIGINIRGREWANPQTGEIKYFNSIIGWKISKAIDEGSNDTQNESNINNNSVTLKGSSVKLQDAMNIINTVDNADDDLPF
jgi:hypothetical protein